MSAQEDKKDEGSVFVINGFYMSMREKYTKAGAQILYYVVEWNPATNSWGDFRGKVLGATDPKTANAGSLRETVLRQYKEFGLTSEPNVGDNGVHGSASPFEAMCERLNWLGATLEEDQFGAQLLAAGIPAATIQAWTKDPQVQYNGAARSLFDSLEDTDTTECLARLASIAGVAAPQVASANNQAFVFIKPHAANAAVQAFVTEALGKAGFDIKTQGALDNKTIEDKKLIDNHYYAIANKASLTLPKDLNPPAKAQAEFNTKWGLTWEKAIADGLVFNAVDGCKKLGIDGDQMDTLWAKTKKADELIKFGGGFYCGKVQ